MQPVNMLNRCCDKRGARKRTLLTSRLHPLNTLTIVTEMNLKFLTALMAGLLLVTVARAAEIHPANEQKGDGSIVLLATNAVVHGKTIRYEPQPHKNTIGYWTKLEDWVSWDFKVSQPGKFDVTLTQSCGKGSGGSEVQFIIGEQVLRDVVPDTGAFTNWTNRTIGTFIFERAGHYQIAVKPVTKPGVAVMDLRAITMKPVK
jgi:hypothetical protein